MNKKDKSMPTEEIIKEISHVTNLKEDITRSVINAFSDIFVREVVMNGKFDWTNCIHVRTHTRKARKQYNVNKGDYFDYPETKILHVSLSKKIKSYHRWKQRNEYNQKHGLTLEDWHNQEKSK